MRFCWKQRMNLNSKVQTHDFITQFYQTTSRWICYKLSKLESYHPKYFYPFLRACWSNLMGVVNSCLQTAIYTVTNTATNPCSSSVIKNAKFRPDYSCSLCLVHKLPNLKSLPGHFGLSRCSSKVKQFFLLSLDNQ